MGKGAETTEVIDGEGQEVEAVIEKKLGVGNREFGSDPVVVCSEGGFRVG